MYTHTYAHIHTYKHVHTYKKVKVVQVNYNLVNNMSPHCDKPDFETCNNLVTTFKILTPYMAYKEGTLTQEMPSYIMQFSDSLPGPVCSI